ncbi:MAG: PspA/IM30 family protein [Gammaproteobacteria bacterium]
MALINRFTSLLTADVHAVLDKIEDPLASLKSAVREMEESLAETARGIENSKIRQDKLQRRLTECESNRGELEHQLDACFDAHEEALAKAVIRKKIAVETKIAAIAKDIVENGTEISRETSVFSNNERQLAAMREKLELLASEAEETFTGNGGREPFEPAISDEAVDIAFLEEQQRRAK